MMQFERGGRNGIRSAHSFSEGFVHGVLSRETHGFVSSSSSSGSVSPHRASSSRVCSVEHRVSMLDTLAGIAIKYGVEVADIKRMNGLVTDRQMFAHEKLQIPLPGRHPPSQDLANGSYDNDVQASLRGNHKNVPKRRPPQHPSRKTSSAMSSLQLYYGLTPSKKEGRGEGIEMAVYKAGKGLHLENGLLPPVSPASDPLPNCHRKSKSLFDGFLPENTELYEGAIVTDIEDNGEVDRSYSEKSVRRRQKGDIDSSFRTPDISVKGQNEGASAGRFRKSPIKPKSESKADLDSACMTNVPIGDLFMSKNIFSVRRSSSTSNLQDSDNSSLWLTTKWSLKADSMTRPLLDGLPKPMSVLRKTAID